MTTEVKIWKQLEDLRNPFNDAVNYRSRQEKAFFNQIFVRTADLFTCLEPAIYFLIGEKGSGKTAYASYLESNDIDSHRCKLSTMTESQHKRFIALKRNGKLDYSDYANIWRPMLLNMVAQAIVEKSKGLVDGFTGKFDIVEEEIATFNKDALNPEVEVAFEMITGSIDKIALGKENLAKVDIHDSSELRDKSQIIKHHLLEKESRLKEAISELKLRKNHVLFIDGIDYRPEEVPNADYIACIKGLGEAAWQLNTEYFSRIRDSKGRIKIVLLVRPDVFHSLNLYNSNSRLRDNSVLLDWSTTEKDLRLSRLYEAADKYFSSQQAFKTVALESADHYLSASTSNEIFKQFLRISFHKPRDLLTLIRITKDISIQQLSRGKESRIGVDLIRNAAFTKEYADYMLGEVRNYAAFYMPQSDFDKYIKFFQYLDGKSEFTLREFTDAFTLFKNWIGGEDLKVEEFARDEEALLQLFYDVNVIGYRENVGDEKERFYHFAFRERSLTNVAPKVKLNATLMINRGLAKALDIGMRVHPTRAAKPTQAQRRRPCYKPKLANLDRSKETVNLAPKEGASALNGSDVAPLAKPKRRRRRKNRQPVAE